MPQKSFSLFLAVVLGLGGVACEHKKTAAEIQAERAQAFRTRQKGEAIKAYNVIVNKYPDSEYAAKAKERLAALGPMPTTPAPVKK